MKTNRKRSFAFTLMWLFAVVVNLAGGYLNYVIWSDGLLNKDLYDRLIDVGSPVAAAVALSCLGVTLAAYYLSLDPHRPCRPVVRIYSLAASFCLFVAGYLLGRAHVGTDNFPVLILAGILAFGVSGGWVWLERFAGRSFIQLAEQSYRSAPASVALFWARVGLAILPSNRRGEDVLGMALARLGRRERARPLLEQAYDDGLVDPDLFQALAELAETDGDRQRAAMLYERVQKLAPSAVLFRKLVTLWQEAGQKEKALEELKRLPAEERRHWIDTIRDLMFEVGDAEGVRGLCHEYEHEGVPFTRTRECYQRLLERFPRDARSLEAMVGLARRSGDEEEEEELLDRLVHLFPDKPDYRRNLLEYHRRKSRRDAVMRDLDSLVSSGAATHEEKLEVANEHFALGDYTRVENLVRSHLGIYKSMEGAYLLAATLYETDRFREALKEVERARELDGETPELRSRISGVEHRIRTQVVEQELRELGERVKVEPDNFELRFQYYDRLVASGSADRVVVDLEDILTRTPDMRDRVVQEIGGFLERHGRNFRLLSYLSDIHLREQDWDRVFELHEEMARESLHGTRTVHDGATKILQNKPDHCPSLLALARHAGEAGHDSNAADFLDRYYAAGGEKTRDVLALEFDVCCRGTDRQRAAQVGANLVELCPGDTDLLMKLGWLAAADGRFPDAIGYLNRVLVLEPENSQARVLTRDYEQKQKRARIDELRSCLKNIPEEDARIQMELGDLHHDFGQMNEAIVAYQKAALGNRTRNIAQAKLGYVLASKGMHSDAEETLSEVELRVDQPPEEQTKLKALLYRSAELMEEEKEMSRALHVYKRIFRVDAGYRDVVSKIERLQRLEKKK